MICDDVRERIDARALGALEPEEAAAVDEHVVGCRDCAASLDEARRVVELLPLAAPLHEPPAALRDRVLAAAAASPLGAETRERAGAAAGETEPRTIARPSTVAGRTASRQARSSASGGGAWRYLGRAAVVAALAIGVGGVGMSSVLLGRVDDLEDRNDAMGEQLAVLSAPADGTTTRTDLADLNEEVDRHRTALAVLNAPDSSRIRLEAYESAEGASAVYYWSRMDGTGVLLCTNLPEPPPGHEYRVWAGMGADPVDMGTLSVAADGTGIAVLRPPDGAMIAEVGVSLERRFGGSDAGVIALATASHTPEPAR